jgi:hypothetical protein
MRSAEVLPQFRRLGAGILPRNLAVQAVRRWYLTEAVRRWYLTEEPCSSGG